MTCTRPFQPAQREHVLVGFHRATRRMMHSTTAARETLIHSEIERALEDQDNARRSARCQAV